MNQTSLCMQEIGCEPEIFGWQLLIKCVKVPDKVGSLYLAEGTRESLQRRQNIGQVLAIGGECFTKNFTFLNGKINIGDWIHYSIIEREPIYANNHDCFYINDDKIIAKLKPEEVPMFLNSRK